MEQLLQQHLPMIRKAAWRASKMWKQDYEEALSIAYEVFIETVGKYEERRGIQFGTYLFHRLRKVNEQCKSIYSKKKKEFNFKPPSKNEDIGKWDRGSTAKGKSLSLCKTIPEVGLPILPKSMEHFADGRIFKLFKERLEFYDSMETELSQRAKELLKWILETEHEKKVSFYRTRIYFTQELNWKFGDLKRAWEEIKIWWNRNNYAFS